VTVEQSIGSLPVKVKETFWFDDVDENAARVNTGAVVSEMRNVLSRDADA
jgi:hypothetical protein